MKNIVSFSYEMLSDFYFTFTFFPAFFLVKIFLYFLTYFLLTAFFPTLTCTVLTLEPFSEPFTEAFSSPMLFTTSLVALEPLRAFFPMVWTFWPTVTVLIFLPMKALALISVTL